MLTIGVHRVWTSATSAVLSLLGASHPQQINLDALLAAEPSVGGSEPPIGARASNAVEHVRDAKGTEEKND